jgi:transposase
MYKRLEKGTFAWPVARDGEAVELAATELMMMLGGVDVAATRRRRWYQRPSEISRNI